MKHYAVATIDVTDRAWVADYVAKVTPMVERHGGRYLARTTRFEQLEGERAPQMLLVVEFPSKEAALGFYCSAEYAPFLAARRAGSRGEFFLVPGEDASRPGVALHE
jgi:uncharacterized protein (DUF1330 family)